MRNLRSYVRFRFIQMMTSWDLTWPLCGPSQVRFLIGRVFKILAFG